MISDSFLQSSEKYERARRSCKCLDLWCTRRSVMERDPPPKQWWSIQFEGGQSECYDKGQWKWACCKGADLFHPLPQLAKKWKHCFVNPVVILPYYNVRRPRAPARALVSFAVFQCWSLDWSMWDWQLATVSKTKPTHSSSLSALFFPGIMLCSFCLFGYLRSFSLHHPILTSMLCCVLCFFFFFFSC